MKGQELLSLAEVPRISGPRLRSFSVVVAKDSSGRVAEPPLEVMPISVWSPPVQGIEPPPSMPEDVGRDRFRAKGDEDSLLSNAELAAGAVSSILRDSDLKRVDALLVEEALALSLQGFISISSCTFICPSYCSFMLYINSTSFFGIWLPI